MDIVKVDTPSSTTLKNVFSMVGIILSSIKSIQTVLSILRLHLVMDCVLGVAIKKNVGGIMDLVFLLISVVAMHLSAFIIEITASTALHILSLCYVIPQSTVFFSD